MATIKRETALELAAVLGLNDSAEEQLLRDLKEAYQEGWNQVVGIDEWLGEPGSKEYAVDVAKEHGLDLNTDAWGLINGYLLDAMDEGERDARQTIATLRAYMVQKRTGIGHRQVGETGVVQ